MKRPSNLFFIIFGLGVFGSVTTYSKNYGGSVLSLAGIIDCFAVPALAAAIFSGLVTFGTSIYDKFKSPKALGLVESEKLVDSITTVSSAPKKPWYKNLKIIIPSAVVLILIVSSFFGQNKTLSKYSDLFLEQERMISDDLQQWNIAVLPISQVVQSLSDGSISIPDAQNKVVTTMPELQKALRQLDSDCPKVQSEISGTSSDIQTINTMFNLLRVGCQTTAQETDLVLAIYKQQISGFGTQENISALADKLTALNKQKNDAGVAALDAMKQYLSPDQLKRASTLKGLLSN